MGEVTKVGIFVVTVLGGLFFGFLWGFFFFCQGSRILRWIGKDWEEDCPGDKRNAAGSGGQTEDGFVTSRISAALKRRGRASFP